MCKLIAGIISVSIVYSGCVFSSVCIDSFYLKQLSDPFKIVLDKTDIVFIGRNVRNKVTTMEAIDLQKTVLGQESTFDEIEIILGEERVGVTIKFGEEKPKGMCECSYDFKIGMKYLVFGTILDKSNGDTMSMIFCSYIYEANSKEAIELINEIRKRKSIN